MGDYSDGKTSSDLYSISDRHSDDIPLLPRHDNSLPVQSSNKAERTRMHSILRRCFASPEVVTLKDTAWLDGLRGVASLAVVSQHWHGFAFIDTNAAYNAKSRSSEFILNYRQWYRLPVFRIIINSADSMVCVFFIISGFVLTQRSLKLVRLARHPEIVHSLSSTVFRRAMRLWLPTSLTTFVGFVLVESHIRLFDSFYPAPSASLLSGLKMWCLETIRQASIYKLTTQFVLLANRYEWVTWTIPLELFGSYVCFVVILGLSRVQSDYKRRGIVASLAVYAMAQQSWFSSNFLTGMLIGDCSINNKAKGWVSFSLNTLLLLLAIILIPMPKYMPYYDAGIYESLHLAIPETSIDHFWTSVAAVALSVALSNLRWARHLLLSPAIQFLGRISFSMYLVHVQVFDLIARPSIEAIFHESEDVQSNLRLLLHYIVLWTTMLPLLFLISSWHERFVDRGALHAAKIVETFCFSQTK